MAEKKKYSIHMVMLALIVLPLMATASYLSKREDAKYYKKMKEVKKQTISSTTTIDTVSAVVSSVNKSDDTETNEHNVPFRLDTGIEESRIVSEQDIGPSCFSGNNITSKIFKDVDCDMNLTPYSKLALVTGIGINVKYPIKLEEPKEKIKYSKHKVNTYKKFKSLSSVTEFSSLLPPLLSKIQLIENCHQFEKYPSLDPVLLNLFIRQRLNDIIWMGIYYSMNYTNFASLYPIDTG